MPSKTVRACWVWRGGPQGEQFPLKELASAWGGLPLLAVRDAAVGFFREFADSTMVGSAPLSAAISPKLAGERTRRPSGSTPVSRWKIRRTTSRSTPSCANSSIASSA